MHLSEKKIMFAVLQDDEESITTSSVTPQKNWADVGEQKNWADVNEEDETKKENDFIQSVSHKMNSNVVNSATHHINNNINKNNSDQWSTVLGKKNNQKKKPSATPSSNSITSAAPPCYFHSECGGFAEPAPKNFYSSKYWPYCSKCYQTRKGTCQSCKSPSSTLLTLKPGILNNFCDSCRRQKKKKK